MESIHLRERLKRLAVPAAAALATVALAGCGESIVGSQSDCPNWAEGGGVSSDPSEGFCPEAQTTWSYDSLAQ